MTGLDHIACVTADMAAVLRFFTEIVDGEVLADERVVSPQPARRVLLQVGDTRVAFLEPEEAGGGPFGAFLNRTQNGIYALVWRVDDAERAKAHFTGKLGLRLAEVHCVASGLAIEPDDFLGARHEFLET